MARMYAFGNVTLSDFVEDASYGSGTDATINARTVTSTGISRLAVSFVFIDDNNAVGSFAGETGGDWTEAVSEFKTSSGSDGCLQLQIAPMPTASQITGGSCTMSDSDPWGARAFVLIPR
jgi:hypothetical protein